MLVGNNYKLGNFSLGNFSNFIAQTPKWGPLKIKIILSDFEYLGFI